MSEEIDIGQKELQARADKIEALGYVPMNVDLDEIPHPDDAKKDEKKAAKAEEK